MKKFIDNYLGILLIFIGIVVGYILLTDTYRVLDAFLFPSLSKVLPLFGEYMPKLWEGFKSSMVLLLSGFSLSLIGGISIGVLIGLRNRLRSRQPADREGM